MEDFNWSCSTQHDNPENLNILIKLLFLMMSQGKENSLMKYSLVLAALGEFVDGYDLIVVGSALLFLKPYFNLSASESGLIGALAFVGAGVGLLIFGPIVDKIGRKRIFMINLLLFVIISIITAFVATFVELSIARFAVGLVIGMDIPATTAFLSEVSPKERRGRNGGALPNLLWVTGFITGGTIGLLLYVIHPSNNLDWRIMFGLAAIPSAIIFIGRQKMPESPRWLYSKGRTEDGDASSKRLNLDIPDSGKIKSTSHYKDLFRGKQLKLTIIVTIIYALNCMAGALTTVAVPYVLKYSGLLTTLDSFIYSDTIYVLELSGVIVGFILIDRIGRRKLAFISMFGSGLFGIVLSFALLGHVISLIVIPYMVTTFLLWMGSGILVWVWAEEMFPTANRAAGGGISNSFCRFALAGNTYLVPVVIASVGASFFPLIFSLPLFIIGIIVVFYKPLETKNKVLESIA